MHVTIARIEEDHDNTASYDEDEVFCENQSVFSQGVEQHFGEERDEDIAEVISFLEEAITGSGTYGEGDSKEHWVDVDRIKAKGIFTSFWRAFVGEADKLVKIPEEEFATGCGEVGSAMLRINEAYNFDGIYVLDRYGTCKTVAEWLRDMQDDERPVVTRYYIRQTYSGKI